MTASLETHIENLKTALSELRATGENGFEGLIAVALYAITGIPFRLASSGYQRGVDGKAVFEGAIAFEGKLYTNDLPRTDVLSKIPDLVRHNDHADLVWILGATCVVPTQLADDLRADGARAGISVLILDWLPSDFPRLAVALAMGGNTVEDFLRTNIQSNNVTQAIEALATIRTNTAFPRHEQAIRKELDASAMGTAMAEKANIKWFDETLSEKALARSNLGQTLAPKDATITVLERPDLVSTLSPYFTDNKGGSAICVHGEEGCGKSWIIIQSWLAQSDKPILIFATPDDFLEPATQEGIEGRLIAKLIAQTGGIESEESITRWRRRLNAWMDTDRPLRPRLILVIDGINQRPDQAWGRIIDNVATYLSRRGGRVIFSTRTHYFNTRIRRALISQAREVSVPKWTANERDEILRRHNVPLNRLNLSVAEFLRNPRILSIALEVFGSDVTTFEELSVERLLFEHIITGVKEDFGEDPADFIAHLRAQAEALYKRATTQTRDDLYIFESDVPAVADGRFYHAVPNEAQKYQLRDEGLILALGLSIIENLRKAERNNRNLEDALGVVLEPIAALDKTAEAVIAAITVCTADDNEYSPTIARALIKGFVELQNPPSHSFATLISFAKARPLALADVLRDLSLQGGHQPNFDWIQAALVEAAKSSAIWSQITEEIKGWLRAYSLSPERRMNYQSGHHPQDKVEMERTKRQEEISAKLEALSLAEKARQSRLVSMEGNIDSLSRLALLLLAGKNLESFADCLLYTSDAADE